MEKQCTERDANLSPVANYEEAYNGKFDSEVVTTVNKKLAFELSTVINALENEEAKQMNSLKN